ncbi:MAG TPA: ABC-type transport auxiliary lipoprotein family protein [Pelagibacterium sp.]|uniref:ABC-type transport auxiliary lipoprotein family protein n=1 Tax=Pelagibacterium sp. TaxID=1967288 RepID=UPI002C9770EB|nr:ABC-type transport auxiliary lipoprotein family protein [Pelagibacterium sp.]HWJ88620.1 ABC-type transport auxiliary lipoprotein family protein [Pelagibacterium sp.]
MSAKIGRRVFLSATAIGLTSVLTGCLGLGATAPVTYDLTPGAPAPVPRRSGRTIVVREPSTIATYDSQRIVVRQPGGVLSYLSESQWSDTLPLLVQTRMLHAFRDAGITNIGKPTDPIALDVILSTDIRAFELDTSSGAPLARVALAIQLVNDRSRTVVASQTFSADVPSASLQQPAVVAALNAALDALLNQIVGWTASVV